jgi:hypothetical protein
MARDIWVTYQPEGDCQCWRDALCPHGWTWSDVEERDCHHTDDILGDVHESLADAVRELYSIEGPAPIGLLLRQRYRGGAKRGTMTVFVMRPEDRDLMVDDHEAAYGPTPYRIIERKSMEKRSRPGDDFRSDINEYRRLP